MTQKELLITYIYNNRCRLEDDIRQLQSNVRFRRIDIADCVELACAIQRLETFNEVTQHVLSILKLTK